ncbi:hypothetical protein [Virgibacillus alimentarius]|uniref:Uncharacterized protein n=1 Tax=Virgibacillus alimentarius TaxID=698769 RepID=A0ABS4S987_9BACI|nr:MULTISPECIES: hypothetical protein [Virgibacillus]MBP2257641.1 hypothetical protein [Virgibacillus alimentarius]HLR68475.1 hypothetical protein [Virgibacillus sp.]
MNEHKIYTMRVAKVYPVSWQGESDEEDFAEIIMKNDETPISCYSFHFK